MFAGRALGRLLLSFWLSAIVPGVALAASDYVAPAPSWALPMAVPAANPDRAAEVSGGLYFLLVDRQIDWREGEVQYYSRYAYQVQSRQGLEEAAAISEVFDPTHETLRVNKVTVTRDGQTIDLTGTADFETFRQEEDLSEGILDGYLTVHANLKDIRVGDIVDYAFTVYRKPKIAAGDLSVRFRTAWSTPTAFARARIILHGDKALRQRSADGRKLDLVAQDAESRTYEWRVSDPQPMPAEANVPSWYDPWSTIEVTTMAGWGDLTGEMAPYYTTDQALPKAFGDQVDLIASTYAAPEERMSRALRLVQDQIRYVGIEIGKGSYFPRSPQEVVTSAYGDCKDKALLLATVLKRLGIESYVALASIDEGWALADRLPSPNAFDHAIVTARIAGETYWLDPTRSHQGGVGRDLAPPNYGWGLPIFAGSAELVPIPRARPGHATAVTREAFEVPKAAEEPVKLTVTTTYQSREADWMRGQLASSSLAATSKKYGDYYYRLYPGATMQGPITVDDDRDANELTVTERYLIDKQELAEGVEDHRWPLRADLLEDLLETPGAAKRRAPVDLPYPIFREHVVSITGEGVHMTALDHITVGNDYFHFSRESESRRGSFTADWSLEIKQPEVPASAIKPYLRDAKDVAGFLWSTYDLSAVLGRGGLSSSKGMTSFAGATPDKPPTPQQLAEMTKRVLWPSAIFLSMSGLIFCAAIFNLRADRAYAQQGFYYPVSLDKFLALSLATWGTYTIFWLWKCNRWRNEFEGGRTWAFWRALFYPFWLFPLFRAANRRNERAPLPRWLGVGAAILSAALYFASFGVSMAFAVSGKAFAVALLLAVLQTACAVPAVLAVNRLHRPGNIALVQNSKYNAWNIVGIVVGIATVFALLLLPRFAAAG